MKFDDIVLSLRRTVRTKQPVVATLLSLNGSAHVATNTARFHYFRNGIADIAQQHGAEIATLPGGEIIIIRNGDDPVISTAAQSLLEDQEGAWTGKERPEDFIETFFLPDAYVELRQKLEECGRQTTSTPVEGAEDNAASEPPCDNRLDGPLTPKLLGEMEDLLDSVDLSQFVQRQAVYRQETRWQPVYVEHSTNIADLTARLFPEVTIDQDLPLFSELRRHLDRLMLINILLKRPFRNQMIAINVEWTIRRTAEFHRLVQQLSQPERRRMVIELHWADYLRDLESGGAVVSELKERRFSVAIDGIGIDMLPIINIASCRADYVKIVFDKAKLPLLGQQDYRDALEKIDGDKMILCECDDPIALSLGQRFGITKFQGWSISRTAREERTAAA